MSAFLSALFVAVYGGSNWLASQQAEVGTWYYAWERFIPFVPWTVVPYMTIDAFFVAAPFLCRDRAELRTLARRITFAILVAGAFFILMPLTLAVERPRPVGWTAPIFAFLHGFDQPFNLFPSLHITLRALLGFHYSRHTRGWLRTASNGWFSLIGISTLLTYQHHIVDVVGGFALATLCFYLFRERPTQASVSLNTKVGTYYAIGCALLVLAALSTPKALLLFWPALGMALMTAACFGCAPNVHRKEDGKLPLSARIVLAPVLLGQRLSCWWYRRQSDPWNKVTPTVWIGAHLNNSEAVEARRLGVIAVLDMTTEFSEAKAFREATYLNLPVMDLTAPSQEQLQCAAEFIERESAAGIVYVQCKAGYSRSAAAVGAYLLASGHARTLQECLLLLRGARPGIVVRPEIQLALTEFASRLRRQGEAYSVK